MDENVAERAGRRPKDLTAPANPSPAKEGTETADPAEWIRLPSPGERCPRTGLSRGTFNDLIFADPPKVKSVVLKKPGASRGVRLLFWPSVRSYLLGLMEEQNQESEEVGS